MHKNFLYYLLPSLITGALGMFVMVPVTTFYLGPKDFGILAILGLITAFVEPLSNSGGTWVLSANYYKIDKDQRKVLIFNILFLDVVMKLFWVLLLWMLTPVILPLIVNDFEPQYAYYFKLLLMSVFLGTAWTSVSYVIVLQKKSRTHAVFEIAIWTAGALTTIVCLAVLKLSTITLFVGAIASGMVSFFNGLWYMRNYITPRLSKKWIKEIVKVGFPSIPQNFFLTIYNSADRWLIQKMMNLSALGIYSHSLIYRNTFSTANNAFNKILVPDILQAVSQNSRLDPFKKMIAQWYGMFGIAGIFLAMFSYDILNVLTHGKFVAAAPLLTLWLLWVFVLCFGVPYTQIILFFRKNTVLAFSTIVFSIISLVVTYFLIKLFGSVGAGVSGVFYVMLIHFFRNIYARRLYEVHLNEKTFFVLFPLIIFSLIISHYIELSFVVKTVYFILTSLMIVIHLDMHKTFAGLLRQAIKPNAV